ncbi:hypothetical protein GMOD_00004651 [Pyrenophora seminiperda CCB06]|uniref:Uncharacterized protein n=1 Tax=Pyrenophora seminiperda CCB06 TaxID=1302712 RepID=A0A3M7MH78_9PLEO|nr:hypothetical protein GMOD_00004651 [Pyrenophora seminiperda CCB06]
MPHSTNTTISGPDLHPTHNLSAASYAILQTLLAAKLSAIPPHHLPALTLSSILKQSPPALLIPHTPSDIQLAFFLRNRAIIDRYGGQPIKDEEKQDMDVTRAIWYYRVDEDRQWVRFHDTTRRNLAIFVALLAEHEEQGQSRDSGMERGRYRESDGPSNKSITPSARRFIKLYLAAVLEHHNTPSTDFTARETFINKWKNSNWDLFVTLRGAQKKMMKHRMKALGKEWQIELDYAFRCMGKRKYEKRIAKFVGCVVPGRVSDGGGMSASVMGGGKGGGSGVKTGGGDEHMTESTSGNKLLDALRVPYTPKVKGSKIPDADVEEVMTVTDVRHAISAVMRMRPRDILPVLLDLFPEDE